MKKIFFIIMTFGLLIAEVNEKEILLKEASRFSLRRQYEKAIFIYKDLEQKFPDDYEISEKLIENYFFTSRIDEAEKLLEDKRVIFPEINYVKLKTSVLLIQSKVKEAEKLSGNYLSKNSRKINNYKLFASIFQRYRQYEHSIKILLEGRNIAQDEYLFSNELANDYFQIKDYPNAIREYLQHVVKNKAYNNYVQNRIKLIIKEDNLQISAVKDFADSSENDLILEIYAVSLGETGDIESALEVYDKLESEKLLKFANNLKKTDDLMNANKAYIRYKSKVNSPELLADVDIKIAELYLLQKDYSEAEQILMNIYSFKEIKNKQIRYKTSANRKCREMLAELALIKDQHDKVVPFLEEAKEFTYNQKEKHELDYRIIHFQIMKAEYERAKENLSEILINEDPGSDIYKKGFYFKYLLSLMENSSESDSLLNELMINLPENDNVNDAIQLSLILAELDNESREGFLEAFRLEQLFRTPPAIDILLDIYDGTENEQILILAGDWALLNGDFEKASEIFKREYLDEDFAQYALLQATLIMDEKNDRVSSSKEFLTQNPKSVFSPGFRKIIAEE